MPKIAILITGEYRTFDICRKSLLFLNDPNVDVYVSTWNKTTYLNPKINLRKTEDVSLERIHRTLNRSAVIKIEDADSFPKEKKYNSRMIHRWKQGIALIENSGVSYDYIVVTRPDILFNNTFPCNLNKIEKYKDSIGFAWSKSLHLKKATDVLFMTSAKRMYTLFNNLTIEKWVNDTENNWHIWWYYYITEHLGTILDTEELNHFVFCRMWANTNHTYSEIVDIQHDWRDLILLGQIDLYGKENMKDIWTGEIMQNAETRWKNKEFEKYI